MGGVMSRLSLRIISSAVCEKWKLKKQSNEAISRLR
jgi:hypothetical protein